MPHTAPHPDATSASLPFSCLYLHPRRPGIQCTRAALGAWRPQLGGSRSPLSTTTHVGPARNVPAPPSARGGHSREGRAPARPPQRTASPHPPMCRVRFKPFVRLDLRTTLRTENRMAVLNSPDAVASRAVTPPERQGALPAIRATCVASRLKPCITTRQRGKAQPEKSPRTSSLEERIGNQVDQVHHDHENRVHLLPPTPLSEFPEIRLHVQRLAYIHVSQWYPVTTPVSQSKTRITRHAPPVAPSSNAWLWVSER